MGVLPILFYREGSASTKDNLGDLQSTTARVHPEPLLVLPVRWVRPARVVLSVFSRSLGLPVRISLGSVEQWDVQALNLLKGPPGDPLKVAVHASR